MEQNTVQKPDCAAITAQARQAAEELLAAAHLRAGDIFVVGCSSSEIVGAIQVFAALGRQIDALRFEHRQNTRQHSRGGFAAPFLYGCKIGLEPFKNVQTLHPVL